MQVEPETPDLVVGDYAALVNASSTCVLVHDAHTKNILWANPAACELLEFSLAEIRPLKADQMSSSAQQYDRVIGRAWLQEAVERGISRIEWHYRSKSGRIIPTDAVAALVQLASGPAVMVQFRDIEREQRVERDLRLTTSYVEALAHHTSTMALMLDGPGRIQFATDSALTAIGEDAKTTVQLLANLARLQFRGTPVSWDELRERARPVTAVQLEVRRDEDTSIWLEGSLERLRVSDSDAFLMILHDVSGRMQDQVRRDRELQRENYLARYNAMGDMAMAIAHELGQPLAAARNFLAGTHARAQRMVAEKTLSVESAAQLALGHDSAVSQIDRASAIVRSLRAFVGHLEQVEQVVDLNEIVEECLYFVRLRAQTSGVEIDTALHSTPVYVRCERVLTGQVVINLCANAVDASVVAGASRVEVSTSPGGSFEVADHGRGIQHDPFAESFTSKEHGSGIGLALSYRIITRQHGQIWAEPRIGGGARFGFRLPIELMPPKAN